MTKLTRCEELKKKLAEAEGAFNQMLAEVKAETQDTDEQNQLLTARVLDAFVRSFSKNKQQCGVSFGPIPKKKRGNPCEKKSQEVVKKKSRVGPKSTGNCYNEQVSSPCTSPSPSLSARNSSYRRRRKTDEDEFYKYYYDDDDDDDDEEEKPQLRESKKRKVSSPETKSNEGSNKLLIKTPPMSIPNPPPPMPLEFKNKIESLGGYRVTLVTHKHLFRTDLSTSHDRLSFTYNQVINKDFLGEEYEKQLRNEQVINVKVISPRLKVYDLGLKRWNSKNSYSYAINRGWNDISGDEKNQLEKRNVLQVWSFRVKDLLDQERIWFALVKLQQDQGKQEGTNSAGNECNDDTSLKGVDSSSITIDEGKEEDRKSDCDDHRLEMMEAIELSSITKKDEGSSAGASASPDVIDSTVAETKQPGIGPRKHYVMKFKFGNVMVAKIKTAVPVV